MVLVDQLASATFNFLPLPSSCNANHYKVEGRLKKTAARKDLIFGGALVLLFAISIILQAGPFLLYWLWLMLFFSDSIEL